MERRSSIGKVERPARAPVPKKAVCSSEEGRVEWGEYVYTGRKPVDGEFDAILQIHRV